MAKVIGTKGDDFIHVAGDGRTAPEGYTDLPAATNRADTIDIRSGGLDLVYAGGGNDRIIAGNAFTAWQVVDGGPGSDTLVLHGYGGSEPLSTGGITNVETLLISPGYVYEITEEDKTVAAGQVLTIDARALTSDDLLVFDGSAETNGSFVIEGGDTHNILTGGNGDDILRGGPLGDTFEGGPGDDTIVGGKGPGDRVSYEHATVGVTVNLSKSGPQDTHGAGVDTISGVEELTGSAYDDTLIGNGADNYFSGWMGDDVINGGGGSDTVYYGSIGNATIDLAITGPQDTGYLGTDTLISIENVWGSAHDDSIKGNAADNTFAGFGGDDLLNGRGGSDTADYSLALGNVTVDLSISGPQNTGDWGTDTLISIENLIGSYLADTLTGNARANRLDGYKGNDVLAGGAGADTLIGGAGSDHLTGGPGADSFVFRTISESKPGAPDLVTDFTHGDRIDLSAIDADKGAAGNQTFHLSKAGGHAGDLVVHYDAAQHQTVIDLYVDDNASVDARILLTGQHVLHAGDFVL